MAHRPLHIPGKRLVITKNMIEIAIANSKSQAQAARWVGVSYTTYKKWAKYYELFEDHKNQSGTGIKKAGHRIKYL